MEIVHDKLRGFVRARRALALELLLCTAAAAGLFVASGRVGAAGHDAQVAFVLCLAGFGASAAQLVPRLLGIALYRCPRCSERFHAAASASRPTLGLRACAHCRLPLKGKGGDALG